MKQLQKLQFFFQCYKQIFGITQQKEDYFLNKTTTEMNYIKIYNGQPTTTKYVFV